MKPEATQSIDIIEFVDAREIDSMLYDTPYYVEPEKRSRRAYALLREALKKTNKVGIAKVVLRTREHLAAVKPSGNALVIELMHYGMDSSSMPNSSSCQRPTRSCPRTRSRWPACSSTT